MSVPAGKLAIPTLPMARYSDQGATPETFLETWPSGPESAGARALETAKSARILSSHLVLEARRVRRSAEPAAQRAFEEARARVMAVAGVQEWLTRNDGPLTIEFGTYVRELCTDLAAIFCTLNRPSLSCEASPRVVPSIDGVLLGLVVSELVTNAFRYGFPDALGGRIAVTFTAFQATSILVVEDSGCDWHPTDSLRATAMRVVQALVDHLGGVLEVSSAIGGNRCTVMLTAP